MRRYRPRDKARVLEDIRLGETMLGAAELWCVPLDTVKSWVLRLYGSVGSLRRKRKSITEDNLPGYR